MIAVIHIIPIYPVYYSITLINYSYKFSTLLAQDNASNSDPGVQTRKVWEKYVTKKKDNARLKIIRAITENVPQLILQIYVYRLEDHQNCFDEHERIFWGWISVRSFQ